MSINQLFLILLSSMKTIALLALTFGLALADIETIRVRLTYKSIAYLIFNYESTINIQAPRQLDEFSSNWMLEEGKNTRAAPECKGQLGWVYHKNFCYMFTSYHETFLKAEEECNKVGGYLADILTKEENDWIKSVLRVINPKDGTDYFVAGLDYDRDKNMQWMTGN